MRSYVPAAAVAAAVIGLTGCGGSKPSGPDSSSSHKPAMPFNVGNTLNYGSFGTTADLDCADGKTLDVAGSNNTLTVTGHCETVRIGGADNKLTIAHVDKELTVLGFDNTVTYKDGDPTVEDHGPGNTITKG